MVDIEARKKAAEIVRQFVSGRMENFEFEESMPVTKDEGVKAIEDTLWCFYDDFRTHKLRDEWAPDEEYKCKMVRWVLFLQTEEKYQWPRVSCPGIRPLKHSWFSKLVKGPKKEQVFLNSGQYEYWPFINKESFQRANQNPTLLTGS